MSVDKTPSRKRKDAIRAARASVLGANRVSPVKVTRADGTVEVQPAYKHQEAAMIVRKRK